MYFHCCCFFQEKETEHLLSQKENNLQHVLQERVEEMRLAIEERELQKMAAISQSDNKSDELQIVIDTMTKVCDKNSLNPFMPIVQLKMCSL